MAQDEKGNTGRIIIAIAAATFAIALGVQVFFWRDGAKLRPEPGWNKLAIVLSVVVICVTLVGRSLLSDPPGITKPDPDSLEQG